MSDERNYWKENFSAPRDLKFTEYCAVCGFLLLLNSVILFLDLLINNNTKFSAGLESVEENHDWGHKFGGRYI